MVVRPMLILLALLLSTTNLVHAQLGGTGDAMGMVDKFCNHCDKLGSSKVCNNAKLMCDRQFCNPICMREGGAWDIDIKCQGALSACGDFTDGVRSALKGMFRAWACVDALKACKDDARLHEWVQDKWYGDNF